MTVSDLIDRLPRFPKEDVEKAEVLCVSETEPLANARPLKEVLIGASQTVILVAEGSPDGCTTNNYNIIMTGGNPNANVKRIGNEIKDPEGSEAEPSR